MCSFDSCSSSLIVISTFAEYLWGYGCSYQGNLFVITLPPGFSDLSISVTSVHWMPCPLIRVPVRLWPSPVCRMSHDSLWGCIRTLLAEGLCGSVVNFADQILCIFIVSCRDIRLCHLCFVSLYPLTKLVDRFRGLEGSCACSAFRVLVLVFCSIAAITC